MVRTASVHLPYAHVHTYTYETHEASNQEKLYPSLVYAHTTQGKRKEHQHIHTLRPLCGRYWPKRPIIGAKEARQYASPASLCSVHRQAVKDHHRDSDQESSPINNRGRTYGSHRVRAQTVRVHMHTHKILFSKLNTQKINC